MSDNPKKSAFDALKNISFLAQLGLSLVLPPVLLLLGANYLVQQLGWGRWVLAVALVLGFLNVVAVFRDFARYAVRQAKKREEEDL